ncbi:hypothetical protein DC366_03585 [Pelagivirga sediminicola]|uniref:Uncharacterized protein n=1 Tax=Pelagivirga sediminicola TaxID=2170575 RepID=A0A2T7GC69_9RHOB|nr:hypothetical protein DC366_03585 [Pelagivirga sediminicola]
MRRQRVTKEVLAVIRGSGLACRSEVAAVALKTDGSLSAVADQPEAEMDTMTHAQGLEGSGGRHPPNAARR